MHANESMHPLWKLPHMLIQFIVTKKVLHLRFKTAPPKPCKKGRWLNATSLKTTGILFNLWSSRGQNLQACFFSILYFIKNVISNLMDICKTIQWKKKKSHRNGVKITTPQITNILLPPLTLNISPSPKGMSGYLLTTKGEKKQRLLRDQCPKWEN